MWLSMAACSAGSRKLPPVNLRTHAHGQVLVAMMIFVQGLCKLITFGVSVRRSL